MLGWTSPPLPHLTESEELAASSPGEVGVELAASASLQLSGREFPLAEGCSLFNSIIT